MINKRFLLLAALLPCSAIAHNWQYEEQVSDFSPTRLQAYLESDSGQVMETGEKSEGAIIISVDKLDPFKYNPRANILLYNDYAAACYKYCSVLFNVDGEVQEPLEVRRLNNSGYSISDSPSFISKIERAKSIKIAVKSATGDMVKFEFKPDKDLSREKLPLRLY